MEVNFNVFKLFYFQTISNLPFSQQVRSVQHLQLVARQVQVVIQVQFLRLFESCLFNIGLFVRG